MTSGTRAEVHKKCRELLKYVEEPMCCKCGKHLDHIGEYCRDCGDTEHYFDRVLPVFEYSDEIKKSIYDFKYNNRRSYSGFFASEIYKRYRDFFEVYKPDIIIPVPMFKKKEKQRGYNQAALLAADLSRMTGIPYSEEMLIRVRKTSPMKDLERKDRLRNLKEVFSIREPLSSIYKVLLIDDIYTTGATMDECSLILKDSGAREVYGIALCIGNGF